MRILIGVVVLALAVPASAALVNGGFESGLTGWVVVENVALNADQYNPNPATIDGVNKAGDSNCSARNSSAYQVAVCDVNPTANCIFTGYLAGGDVGGYSYWIRVHDGAGTGGPVLGSLTLSGVNNWTELVVDLGPCVGQIVTVEFGSTGNGTWGPAGYHVDGFSLECVPEPAALSLLALAGLPLMRRRR